MKLSLTTALVATLSLTIEYWDGGAWSTVSMVTDETNLLTTAGDGLLLEWTDSGDWAVRSVTNQANTGDMYYVRIRVTSFTSVTTAPVGRKVQLDTQRYLPYNALREIVTGVGLPDNASWAEDTISKFRSAD